MDAAVGEAGLPDDGHEAARQAFGLDGGPGGGLGSPGAAGDGGAGLGVDLADAGRHRVHEARRVGGAARQLERRGGLLLHGVADRGHHGAGVGDAAGDARNRVDGAGGGVLSICTRARISSTRPAVCTESALTSCATTAKPRPDSPARAASMVAFSASRLVWRAMVAMASTIAAISSEAVERPNMISLAWLAIRAASRPLRAPRRRCASPPPCWPRPARRRSPAPSRRGWRRRRRPSATPCPHGSRRVRRRSRRSCRARRRRGRQPVERALDVLFDDVDRVAQARVVLRGPGGRGRGVVGRRLVPGLAA